MARRAVKSKPQSAYEFSSVAECEESDKYDGLHLLEPTQWPPKANHGEARPYATGRCLRCGGHLIAYVDNDPNASGVDVQLPVVVKKEKVPA